MELSTHQYLTFLQTNQVLGSGVRKLGLEEICCTLWVIASHLNLFGSQVLFNYGLNLVEGHFKNGFCKQCFDKLYALL